MSPNQLVLTSRGYSQLRHRIEAIATGLMGDLSASVGMAGDDKGGHAFAAAYQGAASETFDKIAFSAFVMAESARSLMETAFNYLAAEDHLVAEWMKGHRPRTDYLQIGSADECNQVYNGRALPHIVEELGWADRNLISPGPKGHPGKLRAVAKLWNRAAELIEDVMTSARGGTTTVEEHWEGQARREFSSYFNLFIGWNDAPAEVSHKEALVPNLVAACRQLAKACNAYADHIEDARDSWSRLFFGDIPDSDHGLSDAVKDDTRIQSLRSIEPALNGHQIPVQEPPKRPEHPPGPGFPVVPFPVPLPVPLVPATYDGTALNGVPAAFTVSPTDPNLARQPISPPPGTPLLNPQERQAFMLWQSTLGTQGFAGGGGPDKAANDYQRYVAGYPEYLLPLPASVEKPSGKLAVDGLRVDDGAAVEAKYVKKPGCSPRSMSGLDALAKDKPFLMGMPEKDFAEMRDYAAATAESNGMVRQVDLAINDPESVVYWQYMMALNHVPGDARYVPAP